MGHLSTKMYFKMEMVPVRAFSEDCENYREILLTPLVSNGSYQVRRIQRLHVDVVKSCISQVVKDVGDRCLSTTDCLETGNTGGYRQKLGSKQNQTK